jgi:ATP-dependent DNA helicase RecQ
MICQAKNYYLYRRCQAIIMSKIAQDTLLKYWGYPTFRPLQEDIVDSVLAGNDSLALLPTGGGKSVCFQVPAMVLEGMCLVVTPLIALMKDQVQQLKALKIPAAAIFSGQHPNELEIIYNQAVFKQLKFLYVSPERLVTERFLESVKRMNINLLAIDESHCISQWGYDFRPPYLRIAEIRPFIPEVPVLALTATATPDVVTDIQEKLKFRKPNVFQTSYERKNLTYNVIEEADKYGPLLRLFNTMQHGSGIVYVRNRKRTREIADWLHSRGISASSYHAGLDTAVRDKRQDEWMRGVKKVMVSTNAFGMGIDKPDVRLVVHLDLPDSLEAYFQEAGRGGRDGKESRAILLYSENDILQLKSGFETTYPKLSHIRAVYQALGNFLQVPVGSGKDQSFDFEIAAFAKSYNFGILDVFSALKLLEKEGVLLLAESMHAPSRIFIRASREDLYKMQVESPYFDPIIKLLLRNYPGVFTDFVKINEEEIAHKLGSKPDKLVNDLLQLQKSGYLDYIGRKNKPQLIFSSERLAANDIALSNENYGNRKAAALKRLQAVIDFVNNNSSCRSIQLLSYFGETSAPRCGKCDVCTSRNNLNLTDIEFENIQNQLKMKLLQRPYPVFELVHAIEGFPDEKVFMALRWMIDKQMLEKDGDNNLKWSSQMGMKL